MQFPEPKSTDATPTKSDDPYDVGGDVGGVDPGPGLPNGPGPVFPTFDPGPTAVPTPTPKPVETPSTQPTSTGPPATPFAHIDVEPGQQPGQRQPGRWR